MKVFWVQVFTDKWDAEGAMNAATLARKCGFDIIEIPLLDPDIDVEITLKALRENQLTPTCSLGLNFSNGTSLLSLLESQFFTRQFSIDIAGVQETLLKSNFENA